MAIGLRSAAILRRSTVNQPVTYVCPGDPEDGGKHLWTLTVNPDLSDEMFAEGARLSCPDHNRPDGE